MALAVKVLDSVFHWSIATAIAVGIAYGLLYMQMGENKPCAQRQCFQLLDTRLASIEAEIAVRTEDRYRGADAKRDQALLMKEIAGLRSEMNNRIDGLKR